jgi:hypothetical protein
MDTDYTKHQAAQAIFELVDIKWEIERLLKRAKKVIAGSPDADYDECTWIANIRIALDRDHSFLASADRTLQDAIDELTAFRDEELEAA